jgi:hypothetical protein
MALYLNIRKRVGGGGGDSVAVQKKRGSNGIYNYNCIYTHTYIYILWCIESGDVL